MKSEDLINWKNVSRSLGKHKEQIRRNYSGKMYKEQVRELKEIVNNWLIKHTKEIPEQDPEADPRVSK